MDEIIKFPLRDEADFRKAFESLLEAARDPSKRPAVDQVASCIESTRVRAALNTAIRWYVGINEHLRKGGAR